MQKVACSFSDVVYLFVLASCVIAHNATYDHFAPSENILSRCKLLACKVEAKQIRGKKVLEYIFVCALDAPNSQHNICPRFRVDCNSHPE